VHPLRDKLSDPTPICLLPFLYVPSKMKIFREMKNDFMQMDIIRPSKSPCMSPAFLVPKNGGGFWMVVNSKIVFHLYPMPMTQQALRKFLSAVVFSVLDLISAYYQITLSVQICQVTAFCKPLGLLNLTNCPWGLVWGVRG